MKQFIERFGRSSNALPFEPLSFKSVLGWMISAVLAFQVAYSVPQLSIVMLVYLFALLHLAQIRTTRQVVYIGLVLGLAAYGPQLYFFWNIFGPGAISLWLVLAFWLAAFLVTARLCWIHFGRAGALMFAPVLWLGFEFFRGELYYLRFTWLNVGYAFSDKSLLLGVFGVYGIGFVFMALVGSVMFLPDRLRKGAFVGVLFLAGFITNLPSLKSSFAGKPVGEVRVAGVQMEFPSENQVVLALEELRKQSPEAELFVLSEYTFDGAIPDRVKTWCRKHQKYLIAGGKNLLAQSQFYNTAFVVGTNGDIVFEQAKSVPIQFFKDGLPAKDQRVWNSPWGKLGLCICYDLSYTRVTDALVKAGAQALIVPTMDVEQWGEHEHWLHARVAPTRAAEYGLPIVRIASSGISQLVSGDGIVRASTAFAVDEATLSDVLALPARGRVPLDRFVAWMAVIITGTLVLMFALVEICPWMNRRRKVKAEEPLTPSPFSI